MCHFLDEIERDKKRREKEQSEDKSIVSEDNVRKCFERLRTDLRQMNRAFGFRYRSYQRPDRYDYNWKGQSTDFGRNYSMNADRNNNWRGQNRGFDRDFRVNRGRNQSYGNGYDRQRTNRSERKSRRDGSMSREDDSRRSEKRRNSPSPSSNRHR